MVSLYIILGIGAFLITLALLLSTKNLISGIVFKVIPALSGLFLILYAVKHLGWF